LYPGLNINADYKVTEAIIRGKQLGPLYYAFSRASGN